MDSFYRFSIIGISAMLSLPDQEDDSQMDIIGELPPEVASIILRLLDGKSLVSASMVSRAWKRLCHGDGELFRRMKAQREHRLQVQEARNRGDDVVVLRDASSHHSDVFKERNGRYAVARKEIIDTIHFSTGRISTPSSPRSPKFICHSPVTPKSSTKKKKKLKVVTPIRL